MDREDIILVLSMFIVGAISGLVTKIGIVLLFWWSYYIKYPNEKYNHKILKKIVVSILFMIVMVGFPSLNNGMPLIFILCTLVMIVREKITLEIVDR
jgi:O-antigen/teichoic acid export membrane protein